MRRAVDVACEQQGQQCNYHCDTEPERLSSALSASTGHVVRTYSLFKNWPPTKIVVLRLFVKLFELEDVRRPFVKRIVRSHSPLALIQLDYRFVD